MKAYVIVTGFVFALIIAAHAARLWAEGVHLFREPVFVLTTLLSLGLTLWAFGLWRRLGRPA